MSAKESSYYMTVQVNGKDEQSIDKDSFIQQITTLVKDMASREAAEVSTVVVRLSRQDLKSAMPTESDEDRVQRELLEGCVSDDELAEQLPPEHMEYFRATQEYKKDPMYARFMNNLRPKAREYLLPDEWHTIMQHAMTHFPLAYDKVRQGFNGPPRPDSVI